MEYDLQRKGSREKRKKDQEIITVASGRIPPKGKHFI